MNSAVSSDRVPTKKRKFTSYVFPGMGEKIEALAQEKRWTESQTVAYLLEEALIAQGLMTREEIEAMAEAFTRGEGDDAQR